MAPPRFFTEDMDDGQEGGKALDMDRYLNARDLYYTARGWDEKGVPTQEKCEMLGLDFQLV